VVTVKDSYFVVERIRQESFSKQQLFSEQPPTFADKN
jgi:hypothetical protein